MLDSTEWQDNIREATDGVISNCDNGSEIVRLTLQQHGASAIEDLSPSDYAEVFDELDFMANDN